jgi:CYTH domain-containing protein
MNHGLAMPHEFERKFLVANGDWKAAVTDSRRLRDGLIARFGEGKVRVRLEQDRAWLTVKGPRVGIGRPEFEYEIPIAEAEEMLRTLCDGPPIEKTRFLVPHAGLVWEVDVHEGALEGLVLAEVEVDHEHQAVVLPEWSGDEVTGDPRYQKRNLLKLVAEAALERPEKQPAAVPRQEAGFSRSSDNRLG